MTGWDFAKAFGVAIAVMVLNIAISFGVMAIYGYVIAPGHDEAFYQDAALSIAPWSSVIGGALLFFAAAWLMGRRKPERNAFAFAATFALIYIAIDAAIIVASAALASLVLMEAISYGSKLLAALAGAWVAAQSLRQK